MQESLLKSYFSQEQSLLEESQFWFLSSDFADTYDAK